MILNNFGVKPSYISPSAGLDYVPLFNHQLEIFPSVSILTVAITVLDDMDIETLEQLTVAVETEGERVVIDQSETQVYIVSDDGKFVFHGSLYDSNNN